MLVLTHPDPALNKAVNEVIPMSSHRFCMSHITKKTTKQGEYFFYNQNTVNMLSC